MSKKTDHKRLWRKEQAENERLRNHIRTLALNAQAANEVVLLLLSGKLTLEQLKKDIEAKMPKVPMDNITKTRDTNINKGGKNDKPTDTTNGDRATI